MPDHSNTAPVKTDQAILRVMIESHLLDTLYARHKALKDALAEEFATGEKHDVKNDQGLKLGTLSKSAPNKRAVCTDESILLAEASVRGMEMVDSLPRPGTPEAVKIINFLHDHAPELLPDPTISKADGDAIAKEVLEQWQITGEVPAGWEIEDASAPRFTLRKGTSAPAKAAMAHLVGEVEGLLEVTAPREIEGGK